MEAKLEWVEEMNFKVMNSGFETSIDATPDHGGHHKGPTPKELVLSAMLGCTAMDVVSMLKKMRQEISKFEMKVEAEKTQHYPTHFKSAVLYYFLSGDIDPAKLIKSVDASLTKYCGVNYMISKTCLISFEIHLNDTLIHSGPVKFIEPKV